MSHMPALYRTALPSTAMAANFFEDKTMLDPKWAVIAVALGVFALAASYDAQLGLAAGVVLAIIGGVYLWIRVRFSYEPDQLGASRAVLSRRFLSLGRNRRAAEARETATRNRKRLKK